ncbi:hypothetical protein OHA21_01340 [Actinoplanes sp. NBC_00393]|uniref:hypothetical protein n=1 Tax=Actinoplanes sp. NBC_00393 TaxID=2975953 RepID=UPI002E1D6F17
MDLQTRADRRFRLVAVLTLALTGLAGVFGALAGAGDWTWRSGAIIAAFVVGLLALMGLAMALSMRWARRRAGTGVSPLWGADRRTRQRTVKVIKRQEEPAGEIGRLALAEADRILKMAPLSVTLMTIAGVLAWLSFGLQLVGGSPVKIAISALPAVLFTAVAVDQMILRRRAGAYLARYGSTP